jgi:hypothetical protein
VRRILIEDADDAVGRATASGRRTIASTTLKIAVLTPMPSAKVSTTGALKPGDLRVIRRANRRSCRNLSMQHRVDAHPFVQEKRRAMRLVANRQIAWRPHRTEDFGFKPRRANPRALPRSPAG